MQTPVKQGVRRFLGRLAGIKKPGIRYRMPRFLLRDQREVTFFSHALVLPAGNTGARAGSAFAGGPALAPRDTQALTTFPQAFAADTELAGQLGLGHVVLVFEYKVLEVVFQ